MDVDLRLLRYFVAVAEELHFNRAARRLFISQPALSQQIRKLESDLGLPLFVRDRRSVGLTAAGSALLAPAVAAVESAAAFALAARRHAREQRRELVVGFHTRWPDNFLPRVVRAYRELCPDVTVDPAPVRLRRHQRRSAHRRDRRRVAAPSGYRRGHPGPAAHY